MPELPEVTTIVSDLNKFARGKKIIAIKGDTSKLIQPYSFAEFKKKVGGRSFVGFKRRGKYVLGYLSEKKIKKMDLEDSIDEVLKISNFKFQILVLHMRMTGHLLFRNEKKEGKIAKEYFSDRRNQYIRFSIIFSDKTHLDFSDLRKFGTLHLFEGDEIGKCKGIATLGPDALEHPWKPVELQELLKRKNVALKQVLLDQTVIAGIGNIYADEILWTAKLHPLRKTNTVSVEESEKIILAMKKVLKSAVKHRGSSVDDYRDVSGKAGDYSKFHRVYQRKNLPCFRCGEKIVRIKVNGRGTCFCPVCQKQKTLTLQ
ncbi:MAG: bifunctional DNA-formamidopyrimidine glycosylase/DNA-(apurinic or apyrimidinic site) lyase [bacterium]|nr:bifunctional DNA-formamidopyrimidine glycosylase/DNA-(apurinic or apyrimidinic site) lyase [bacterium]